MPVLLGRTSPQGERRAAYKRPETHMSHTHQLAAERLPNRLILRSG